MRVATLPALTLLAIMPGTAAAAPLVIDMSAIIHEHGPACHGVHWGAGAGGLTDTPAAPRILGADTNPNGTPGQVVFVDFSGPATFEVGLRRVDGTSGIFVAANGRSTFDTFQYSSEQRSFILEGMRQDYAGFNISFTDTAPVSGEFTHLEMNNPAIRRISPTRRAPNIIAVELDDNGDGVADRLGLSILFGLAGGIDFRNKYLSDSAFADGNLYRFLEQAELSLSAIPPGSDLVDLQLRSVRTTGSHELGHVLGLRHHDALGPIGTGVNGLGTVGNPDNFNPAFTGPAGAFATNQHIMSSGASTGRPLSPLVDRYFGLRESAKLAFNEQGVTRAEDRLAAGATDLRLELPNFALADGTVVTGDETGFADAVRTLRLRDIALPDTLRAANERAFYGGMPLLRATNIEGRIARPLIEADGTIVQDLDLYALNLKRESFLSFEVLASTPSWAEETFFPVVGIFDHNYELLRYFTANAVNFQDPERGDPLLFDFLLGPGAYHVGVWSPYNFIDRTFPFGRGEFISGLYELYITSFAVPAPAGLALFGLGAGGLMAARRRRIRASA